MYGNAKKYTHDELNKDENFKEKIQVLTGGHLNTPFGSPTRGEQNTKKSHAPLARRCCGCRSPEKCWVEEGLAMYGYCVECNPKKHWKNTRKIKTMRELW